MIYWKNFFGKMSNQLIMKTEIINKSHNDGKWGRPGSGLELIDFGRYSLKAILCL